MIKRFVRFLPALAAAATLSACAYQTPPAQPETAPPQATQLPDRIPVGPAGLEGTVWQLVEFQSMDDAQGTTRPADPSRYVMRFGADGSVGLTLDCNTGGGSYESAPAQDGSTGSLAFSRIVSTLMLCPPPSMGDKLASDLAHVRGYALRDGRLATTLMADGGIYIWEPLAPE